MAASAIDEDIALVEGKLGSPLTPSVDDTTFTVHEQGKVGSEAYSALRAMNLTRPIADRKLGSF
jgi:hypothetical protein